MKYVSDLTQKLVREISVNPPGSEKGVAEILAKELKDIGMDVKFIEIADGRPNIIATWKGNGKKNLIIGGHLDTVPVSDKWKYNPFAAIVEDGKIYGRGAADMKGGLASAVSALRNLKKSGFKPNGNIIFLGYANEETGDGEEIGLMHVCKKIKGDLMLLADSSDLNVITAEKGVIWYELECKGKSAHSSTPWEGENAVENLGAFLVELKKMKFEKKHPLLGNSTLAITMFHGGIKTNVIPSSAKARIDIRIVPGESKEKIREKIDNILKSRSNFKNITIKETLYYAPVEIKIDDNINKLIEIVKKVTGRKDVVRVEHGASGAGFFIRAGTPTVACGPGKLKVVHATDEYIDIEDLEKSEKIYEEFIKAYFK